jgi:hypothetical protein
MMFYLFAISPPDDFFQFPDVSRKFSWYFVLFPYNLGSVAYEHVSVKKAINAKTC